jgi:hypothetical protein
MKKLLCIVALAGIVSAVPAGVEAQMSAGPAAAFHDDLDFGIGAFLSVPVPSLAENLSIVPSFIYYFPDGVDAFEINGDVMYAFEVSEDTPVLPFAFAGLNIMRVSLDTPGTSASNTEIGLNLGGGITFRAESVRPFVGAKFEIGDADGFVIFGGIGFPIG